MHNEYKTFETERLLIKPTDELDAAFILELLNTPKWYQFMGDYRVYTIKAVLKFIQDGVLAPRIRYGYSDFTVIRKSDKKKIGTCGLYHRKGIEGVDLGFAFLPQYEKQGYAFESASKLKEIAYHEYKIESLNAMTTKDNIASQKLIKRLGFSSIGEIKLPDKNEVHLLYQKKRQLTN